MKKEIEEKKDLAKLKKETEEKYLRIDNKIKESQKQLNELIVEKARLEGEYRILDKLQK